MKRRSITAFAALALFAAQAIAQTSAQAPPPAAKKVAVVSLIGDTMSIEVYTPRTDSRVDVNAREVVKLPSTVFDLAALRAVKLSTEKAWPGAEVVTLAVPAAGTASDPANLVADGKLADPKANAVADALQREGFTHLIVASKHRAPARFKLTTTEVGTGMLQGIGFYVDRELPVRDVKTGDGTPGYLAPYAYYKLTLVDVATRAVVREELVTASTIRLGTESGSGIHPWNAMTGEQKTTALQSLIDTQTSARMPALLSTR